MSYGRQIEVGICRYGRPVVMTERLQDYMTAIKAAWAQNGALSIPDICRRVGVKSTSSGHRAFQRLTELGLIKRIGSDAWAKYAPAGATVEAKQ